MAAQETPPPDSRQNTLYHGTMIDLTDAPDDPIDLTEEDDDVQIVPTNQSPQKPVDQTPPPPTTKPSQPIILNHTLNVYSPLQSAQLSSPLSTTMLQSQQAKPKQPLVATQPIRAKTIDKLQKPVQPTAVSNSPQTKPSQQLFQKQAMNKQPLNSGATKLDTERVLTKVPKAAYAKLQNSNVEKIQDQLARWRKSQDELSGTTASHVKITQTAVERPRKKNEVWPKLNLYGPTGADDPIDDLQSVVDQVEPNAAQPGGGVPHVPVLAPCLDTSGQYVLLPTAMLRQMMVPMTNNTASAQPYFIMPNMSGAAQPAMPPIVVQNVENQSNYIKSVVNTAPTAISRPVQAATPPPHPPPPPPKHVPTRPFRKTDQHLTMQISSGIVKRQLDVHRQEIEELDPFSNDAVEGSESSYVDLTTSNDDNALKQEDGQVNSESIDLTDGLAEDPLDDTVQLPETIVMDTVTPIDIGTILLQPMRAIAEAPSEEWCFDTVLSPDCLKYTMRGDKFIGFPRPEWERKAICQDIVVELYNDNLRSLLKHKKLLRDLDLQARRLRQQTVSTYVTDGRGQFKKPLAYPVEKPFLPRKNYSNFLPPKRYDSSTQGESSSDDGEPTKKKRGRPPKVLMAPMRNAPSTSGTAVVAGRWGGHSEQMKSKRKYVFSKKKAAVKYVAKDISAEVPVKRVKKVKKKPPARPRVEAMTDADNPNEEESDLFVVKKVQILNKDHDVVSLRYNPNCV